ncbi:uncharacterized protein LOC110186997 [Drosophila serrata]|uniref:uncharacterized protein LOC110186997 n=1 Tax=Drosophila serrata TaxID=7274 RepID=UPI000A1CFD7C|nr:uncharacterized protein LOC110186997 [Drosophila serrata]
MRDSPISTITTIPIVIDSKPNPRILLIKVPTSSSNNRNCSNCNVTEPRAPRTRVIRIPFLPGSVPTRPPANRASPATRPIVNPTDSVTPTRIATYTTTGTATSHTPKQTLAGLPTTEMVNQTVPVSIPPPAQTLASMAGIQLTGADEPPSRRDMSGAMPTATVEEIDVPVFIDEYLQDIEATSSTCSSENGKEIFTETDILDFDINMFAEEDFFELDGKKMDPYSPTMDEMNNDTLNDDYQLMDGLDLPLHGEEETLDMTTMCGIDIPHQNEDFDLTSILTGSQDPMMTTFSQPSFTTTKIFTEEPLISDGASYAGSTYGCSQESLGFGLVEDVKPSGSIASTGDDLAVAIPAPIHHIASLKRCAPAPVVETQAKKRSRLAVQINTQLEPVASEPSTPDIIEQLLKFDRLEPATTSTSNSNTSNVTFTTAIISQADIVRELRSAEEETTNDFSPPNTPHSNYSASSSSMAPTCQTGFGGFLTAPASPAYSVASTSQFSNFASSNKRKRGRPAKDHADGPDPELMSRMSGDERKAYQDRIKNNEASRISRRKTKKREEEEKEAEDKLMAENLSLRAQADEVALMERKYKKYLMERQRKNSTYIKKE